MNEKDRERARGLGPGGAHVAALVYYSIGVAIGFFLGYWIGGMR